MLSACIVPPYHQAHLWEVHLPLRLAMRTMYWFWLASDYTPIDLHGSYDHWLRHCINENPATWPLSCPELEQLITAHSDSWSIVESLLRQLVEDRQTFRLTGLLPGWSLPFLGGYTLPPLLN